MKRVKQKIGCVEISNFLVRARDQVLAERNLDLSRTSEKVLAIRQLKSETEKVLALSRDFRFDRYIDEREAMAGKFGFEYIWPPNKSGIATAREIVNLDQDGGRDKRFEREEFYLVNIIDQSLVAGPFREAQRSFDQVLVVVSESNYQLVDTTGKPIGQEFSAKDYDCLSSLHADKCEFPIYVHKMTQTAQSKMKKMEGHFFLTETGQRILEHSELLVGFHEGLAWVKKDGNTWCVDMEGNFKFMIDESIDKFHNITEFRDGFALANISEGERFRVCQIDREGRVRKLLPSFGVGLREIQNSQYYLITNGWTETLLKTNGWSHKMPNNWFVIAESEGIFQVDRSVDGRQQNSRGKIFLNSEFGPISNKIFAESSEFSEGFAIVSEFADDKDADIDSNESQYYFIDKKGEPLRFPNGEIIYSSGPAFFSEGRAIVSDDKSGSQIIIDTAGNIVDFYYGDTAIGYNGGVMMGFESDYSPHYLDRYGRSVFGYINTAEPDEED
ncbi:MAG: hypothetical protein NTW50_05280 [Candidatus Berkelbacteria bacterium]|nr:hypothetical protein [Candidatus Berkelbacteria bacterium]